MFKIDHGLSMSFDRIAKEYYSKLNPKTKTGSLKKSALQKRVKNGLNKHTDPQKRAFFNLLSAKKYKVLKELIMSEPKTLSTLHSRFEAMVTAGRIPPFYYTNGKGVLTATPFGEEIQNLFGYTNQRGGSKILWLVKETGIKICPYCNYGDLFIIKDSSSGKLEEQILHDIDHFIPKVIAPYLSLSFFNLVPCCSYCNSRCKSTTIFDLANYIHPYKDDMNSLMTFTADRPLSVYTGDCKILINTITTDPDEINRMNNSNGIFQILPRYNEFTDEVKRMRKISERYSLTNEHQIKHGIIINGLSISDTEYEGFIEDILSVPKDNRAAANTRIGKFKRDMAKYLEILS